MSKQKPIIIEFAGLYGSGKTVTGQALTKELREQGYIVRSVHDFYEFRDGLSKLSRWLRYTQRLSVWKFFFPAFLSYVRGSMNFRSGDYDLRQTLGPLKDASDREYFLKKECQDADFVVFDEGSINDCVNLAWRFGVPKKIMLKQITSISYLKNAEIMLFPSDIDVTFERINKRNGETFIDYEKKGERLKILQTVFPYYEAAYEFVFEKFVNVTAMDLSQAVEERVRMVKQLVVNKDS